MRIEAYLVMWNELDMVKLVVSHYQKFCDRIIILDNWSTDGSDKLAESLGCEVVKFGTKFFDDEENRTIKNNCWNGSDADWVIVADFDECLFGYYVDTVMYPEESWWSDIQEKLLIERDEQKSTIIKTIGWQIMSDDMPKENLTEITNGFRFDNYSKSICFNPKEIKEINYGFGAHRINPVGNVVYSTEELYVLHYKHIGGVERTIKRYAEYKPRMSKNNRRLGHGIHYQQSEQRTKTRMERKNVEVTPVNMKKATQRLLISVAFCTLLLQNIQCMDKSTKEIWKDIIGLEGGYQISNFGRVKSLPRLVLCKGLKSTRLTKENFVRPQVRKGKYLKVKLTFNGKLEQPTIHRLVANHFIHNPENKPQVNHIDGNQSNNHIDNLEWVTGKENMHHWMYKQGRVKTGEKHSNSKLTDDDVLKIREEYSTLKTPTRQLAKKYNVVQGTIMWVLKRSTWNHI